MFRVLTQKKVKDLFINNKRLIDFSNNLTNTARKFDGFIKSESFWNYKFNSCEPTNLLTFSEWCSETEWNKWLYSYERDYIFNKHNVYNILDIQHSILTKTNSNQLFLL